MPPKHQVYTVQSEAVCNPVLSLDPMAFDRISTHEARVCEVSVDDPSCYISDRREGLSSSILMRRKRNGSIQFSFLAHQS